MSNLANDFLLFLSEKTKQTGSNEFSNIDYMEFNGYEEAISELSRIGKIEKVNDIVGTIKINPNK